MADKGQTNMVYDDNELKNTELIPIKRSSKERMASAALENGHTTELAVVALPVEFKEEEPVAQRGWKQRHARLYSIVLGVVLNAIAIGYFIWATYHYVYLSQNYPEVEWPPVADNTTDTEIPDYPSQDICPRPDPCIKLPIVHPYCPKFCGIQWCNGYGMLLILYTLIYIGLFYYKIVKPLWGSRLYSAILRPIRRSAQRLLANRWRKLLAGAIVLAALLVYVVIDARDSLHRLQPLIGIFVFFAIGYAMSAHRSHIKWQVVLSGFVFQFLLGILCIRWDVGRSIFRCVGDKVATFLKYTDHGSRFVYGTELVDKGIFVFTIMPIIFFFSFNISILYYLGAMQWIVQKLGWILQSVLGTTVCESVTCAANIFLGMSESPLLIRPYIKHLTASEIHVIMASGFATVSGSVLAAYIAYGADPAHLITSSVMAAPAALGFAKLCYPETEESKTKSGNMVLEKSTDTSILDAAANGATLAIQIVLGITANIVAFVSFVAFLNGLVAFFGHQVGLDMTFEWIFGKIFIPLAWVIGVPWDDCEPVAMVIASKTIVNEFVAYERLGRLKAAGVISLRSSAIATYAICGFANPSSLGIMIATTTTMAPEKRRVITVVALRGFVAGSLICFLTASIAGILMTDDIFEEIAARGH